MWLVAAALVAAACTNEVAESPHTPVPPVGAVLPPEAVNATWQWVSFTSPVEKIVADAPDRYTLQFQLDGKVAVRVDCNRGAGTYVVAPDRRISFGPIALTRMMCPPGSQADRYMKELGRANSYFLKDGDFFIELPFDSGTLRFRR